MMRRFVLIALGLTVEQEKHVVDRFANRVGWWHQMQGTWLIVDQSDLINVGYLRGIVQEVAPKAEVLALEVDAKDWALRLDDSRLGFATTWLRGTWMPGMWEALLPPPRP